MQRIHHSLTSLLPSSLRVTNIAFCATIHSATSSISCYPFFCYMPIWRSCHIISTLSPHLQPPTLTPSSIREMVWCLLQKMGAAFVSKEVRGGRASFFHHLYAISAVSTSSDHYAYIYPIQTVLRYIYIYISITTLITARLVFLHIQHFNSIDSYT